MLPVQLLCCLPSLESAMLVKSVVDGGCTITRNVSILSAHISDMVETNLQQYDTL